MLQALLLGLSSLTYLAQGSFQEHRVRTLTGRRTAGRRAGVRGLGLASRGSAPGSPCNKKAGLAEH